MWYRSPSLFSVNLTIPKATTLWLSLFIHILEVSDSNWKKFIIVLSVLLGKFWGHIFKKVLRFPLRSQIHRRVIPRYVTYSYDKTF